MEASAPLPRVPAIVAGSNHVCVLNVDGTARCFGNNENGALGDGTTTSHPLDPVRVKLDELAQLSAGNDFTCALRRDRSVWCWGTGVWSIFSDNTAHPTPTNMEGLPPVRSLSRAGSPTCAVVTDGRVFCRGYDSHVPLAVPGIVDAVGVVNALAYVCGITAHHDIWCWGDGYDGFTRASKTPSKIASF
jgi:alpha-tubulin suppressor-like RCC1 family protein